MPRLLALICVLMLARTLSVAGPSEDALRLGEEAAAKQDYVSAITTWINAYNERSTAGTANDETCAKLLFKAGTLLSNHGRYQDARNCLDKLVALRRQLNGPEHPDTAIALSRLAANTANGGGSLDEAESLSRQAVDALAKAGDERLGERLTAMGNLGTILLRKKDRLAAHEQFVKALELCEKHPGKFLDAEVNALTSMAVIAEFFGRFKDQIQYLNKALAAARRLHGADSVKTFSARIEIADALAQSGDNKAAREAYLGIIKDFEKLEGARTDAELMKKWALAEYRLAYVESALGNAERTLELLKSSLEEARVGFGEFDENLVTIYLDLAKLHLTRKNYDEGIRCYQAVLDIRRRVHGPDHQDTKDTQELLNQLYAEVERVRGQKKTPLRELKSDHAKPGITSKGVEPPAATEPTRGRKP